MSLVARVLLLVVLAAAPAFALHLYQDLEQRRASEARIHDEALRLASFAAGELTKNLEGARIFLEAIATLPSVRGLDPAGCAAYLEAMQVPLPFRGAFVIDPDGRIVCSSRPLRGVITVADRSYFQRSVETRQFAVGEAVTSRIDGVLSLPVALPLVAADGTVRGVVAMGLDAASLEESFAGKSWPSGGSISIVDRSGTIVVRWPNRELVGQQLSEPFRWMLEATAEGTTTGTGPDGVERIGGFLPPAINNGLLVSVALSRTEAMAPIDHALRRDLLLLGIATAVALLAAVVGGWFFIRRPVERLQAAASRLTAGDLTARVGLPDQGSELGQLGAAFDSMAEAVAARELALRRSEELFRQFAENVPEVVWVEDIAGRAEYVGPAFDSIWGRSGKDVEAERIHWLDAVEPEDRPIIETALAKARQGSPASAEYRIRRPDGSVRWLHSTAFPIRDLDGSLVRIGRVSRDISERRALEAQRLQALHQRDLLFAELNHRIKNNLQIVRAFLVLQGGRVEDPAAREALTAAGQRIGAVGELHALLYRNGEIGGLDLGAYLRAICASLEDALIGGDGRVRLDMEIASLWVDMDCAVLVGLIASELVTNSLKYAYPSGSAGRVLVRLERTAPRRALLRVADAGRGLGDGTSEGFGLRVFRMLARQLEAEVTVRNEGGVTIDVDFAVQQVEPGSDARPAA